MPKRLLLLLCCLLSSRALAAEVWPGADFQEREAWDLYGIKFPGHPNMSRILLWEGFNGHPMRKDWHEAYYEEEHKPFESRWPRGYVRRAWPCSGRSRHG